jgi:hypothetical protein
MDVEDNNVDTTVIDNISVIISQGMITELNITSDS